VEQVRTEGLEAGDDLVYGTGKSLPRGVSPEVAEEFLDGLRRDLDRIHPDSVTRATKGACTPQELVEAIRVNRAQDVEVERIRATAQRSHTLVRRLIVEVKQYRERLLDYEATGSEVRKYGFTRAADRVARAEQVVEEKRRRLHGEVPTLHEQLTLLQHLEERWHDLLRETAAKVRLVALEDQFGKTVSKLFVAEGKGVLRVEPRWISPEELATRIRAEEAEEARVAGGVGPVVVPNGTGDGDYV
jgi:hypothetical protein